MTEHLKERSAELEPPFLLRTAEVDGFESAFRNPIPSNNFEGNCNLSKNLKVLTIEQCGDRDQSPGSCEVVSVQIVAIGLIFPMVAESWLPGGAYR
jgi:hypothetical protein